MPLRADLLTPIPGDNPSGANLRYDPVIDKIKEARREDVDAPQGAWKTAIKTADYAAVIKLAGEVIATRSKDLQLAVWLVEAHIRREGLPVVGPCFKFIHEFLEQFWDTLYPEIEDGDVELRAGPLEWLGQKLDLPVRQAPITQSGYSYLSYKESRIIGFEADAQGSYDKMEIRNARIAEGKLTGEQFDESVDSTPMGFYGTSLSSVHDAMTEIQNLLDFCDERMGDDSPGFTTTRKALEDVAQLLELFLRKKGGAVELPSAADDEATDYGLDDVSFSFAEPPPKTATTTDDSAAAETQESAEAGGTGEAYAEPQSEADVVTQILAIAKYLRNADAQDISPYLITRAYHWGKLRNGSPPVRQDALEPPPTELRVKLKKLFLANDWGSLLTEVEDSLGLPCAGPWLDLHRYAVLALEQQGMTPIAGAIKTELRGLLQDLPDLQAATLLDDTPTANADTQSWLNSEVAATPANAEAVPAADSSDLSTSSDDSSTSDTSDSDTPLDSSSDDTASSSEPEAETTEAPAEVTTFDFPPIDENPPIVEVAEPEPDVAPEDQDVFDVAVKTLKNGDAAGSLRLLTDKLANERSNRARFRRRTQIAHLLLSGGRPKVARPLLDQLASEIEERRLDEWEDGSVVAYPLELLLRCLPADPSQEERKTELYTRLCKLDPVRAMSISN